MKKLIYAVALTAAATTALVACGSRPAPQAAPVTTTTTAYVRPTTTTTTISAETRTYLRQMRIRFPGLSDSSLLSLGQTACDLIDLSGGVGSAIYEMAADPRFSDHMDDVGYMMGNAIPTFCPEYIDEAIRWADSQ